MSDRTLTPLERQKALQKRTQSKPVEAAFRTHTARTFPDHIKLQSTRHFEDVAASLPLLIDEVLQKAAA